MEFDSIKRSDVKAPNLGTRLDEATHAVRVFKGRDEWAPTHKDVAEWYAARHGSENVRVIEGPAPKRRVWVEKGSSPASPWVVKVNGAWADQWAHKPYADAEAKLLNDFPQMPVLEARQLVARLTTHPEEGNGA